MAAVRYKYTMKMTYLYNGELYTFDSKYIMHVFIDYDYYNKNMPVLIIKAKIDKRILADMIKNSDTKKLNLTISRHIVDEMADIAIIRDAFTYIIDPSTKVSDIDYNINDDNSTREDIYTDITIGLVSDTLIKNNKRMVNEVVISTSVSSFILKHMGHMKLLVEPFANKSISRLIVPPISTITRLINFLNGYYTIYPSGYILYYDFNMTYLLSRRGTSVPAVTDITDTIIFESTDAVQYETGLAGVDRLKEVGADYMMIPYLDIKIFQDKSTDLLYSKILGVGTNGETNSINLNNDNTYKGSVAVVRNNKDLATINNIQYSMDQEKFIVILVKQDMDTSSLTINKPYYIRNHDGISPTDKYILCRKQDIFTKDGKDYLLTTQLTLKKAP